MSNNILIIGDGGRKDILSMFSQVSKSKRNNTYFIEQNISPSKEYDKYGFVIKWNQFECAFSLLKNKKISKVVFLHFGDYNEIAIRVACQELHIKTYMLSHGLSFPNNLEAQNKVDLKTNNKWNIRLKQNLALRNITYLKNTFYKNTTAKSSRYNQAFLKSYFKTRSKNTMLDTFKKMEHDLLKLDYFICFNKSNREWFIKKHKLTGLDCKKFLLIGFPIFDSLVGIKEGIKTDNNRILLIDQPFYEKSLLGWTLKHKQEFIDRLLKTGKEILVKPHPLNNVKFWNDYPTIKVITKNNDFIRVLTASKIVLGFNSTLLLPLAALNNKVIFALENHPVKQVRPYFSSFLTESGVAKLIMTSDELEKELENLSELMESQNKNKEQFTKDWLYQFDGKSKSRLTTILEAK